MDHQHLCHTDRKKMMSHPRPKHVPTNVEKHRRREREGGGGNAPVKKSGGAEVCIHTHSPLRPLPLNGGLNTPRIKRLPTPL